MGILPASNAGGRGMIGYSGGSDAKVTSETEINFGGLTLEDNKAGGTDIEMANSM